MTPKILISVVAGVIVGLLLGWFVFPRGSAGAALDSADAFAGTLKAGSVREAYDATTQEFQDTTTESEFRNFLVRTGLRDDLATADGFEFDEAAFAGKIKRSDGEETQFSLLLTKRDGEWVVTRVDALPPEIAATSDALNQLTQEVTPQVLQGLIVGSLMMLDNAIAANDFNNMYQQLSPKWQETASPEALKEAYKSFVDGEVDLSPVVDLQPQLDPNRSGITEEGVLVVVGYFDTQPNAIQFELAFEKVDDTWRPLQIGVNVAPLPQNNEAPGAGDSSGG